MANSHEEADVNSGESGLQPDKDVTWYGISITILIIIHIYNVINTDHWRVSNDNRCAI